MAQNQKSALLDMAEALRKVFQKYTIVNRKRAWNALTSKPGDKAVQNMILHPNMPTNKFKQIPFSEWVAKRDLN
jgi:hypothetical protein